MYLNFSKKDETKHSKNVISFNTYQLSYELEKKDIFKETEDYYLFLRSNYAESYTEEQLLFSLKSDVEKQLFKAFGSDGFWVLVYKKSEKIVLSRNFNGLCIGYYYRDDKQFIVSSNMHKIASNIKTSLNKNSIYQQLYYDFIWDGDTIYKDIFAVKLGGKLVLNKDFKIIDAKFQNPELQIKENKLSENENIKQLRKEIVLSHKKYINDNNIIFLSGGIDSVAMLIAIDDLTTKDKIECHSFKVKGTKQDETVYAESIANHLKVNLKIIERDLQDEINLKTFKKNILEMNNPYPGMWIFGNQIKDKKKVTYFAGQDTRLHTPSLNKLDILAFQLFSLSKKGFYPFFYIVDLLLFPIKKLFDFILIKKKTKSKIFLGLRRALYLFNTKKYIELVYFKVDKIIARTYNLPMQNFDDISEKYQINLKNVTNKRELYNKIVSKKWMEQYVNDMRYMVDMANRQGGNLAMPFYDMQLANFSASIPFKLAVKTIEGKAQFENKKAIVKKFVLRKALENKIDQKTFLRSKAVSRTGHLIFNQGLDIVLKQILNEDLNSENSIVKEYKLQNFSKKFIDNKKEWKMNDDKYLLKIYYLVSLIVYLQNISEKC